MKILIIFICILHAWLDVELKPELIITLMIGVMLVDLAWKRNAKKI